jgi:hypothetical protein
VLLPVFVLPLAFESDVDLDASEQLQPQWQPQPDMVGVVDVVGVVAGALDAGAGVDGVGLAPQPGNTTCKSSKACCAAARSPEWSASDN